MRPLDLINQRFKIADRIQFDTGQGGMTRAILTGPKSEAQVYLHGAHVTHFAKTGEPPLLFMSKQSAFMADKPIRGGVPICFPWFGPKNDPGHPDAPIHGIARLSSWSIQSTSASDDAVTLVLALGATNQTRRYWPAGLLLRFTITISDALSMELAVTNPCAEPVTFEEALHTYFSCPDVRNIWIDGLDGAEYLDKVDNFAKKKQEGAVRIAGETDRLYLNATSALVIHDPVHRRKIINAKDNSNATVVWNPWIAKAKAMPDFGDDEWPGMICVETCNANANSIQLPPGQTHVMRAVIRTEPL